MFKKYASLMMAFLLAVMWPAAGLAEAEAAELHPDYPVFEWERDAREHWKLLESGEKTEVGAHELEDVVCNVCGSEVWIFEDGCADVSNYNEYYELLRATSYDENGEIAYDNVYSYGYDEDGNKLWEKQFENGLFVSETAYALNADGENHPVWSNTYYDDGTSARNEYDEHGNCVKAFTYDVDGTVTYESTSEFKQDADGWYYEAKTTAHMGDAIFIDEYNEYGDKTLATITEAGVVILDSAHEYGYEDGQMRWSKDYMFGVLIGESVYDEEGSEILYTEYLEDGTKSVTEYDENDDPAKTTKYTADGAVDYVETFVYVYNDSGLTRIETYMDGVLREETRFGHDEDGFFYAAEIVTYDENGNATVTKLESDGNVIE